MGNNCGFKAKTDKKKVFTLRKISDFEQNHPKLTESPKEIHPPLNFNLSPRRKSSFYRHSNANNGKVTFKEREAKTIIDNVINMNSAIKRNSMQSFHPQVHPLPHTQPQARIVRETSIIEKRRTSEGFKMINEYQLGKKLGEGSFGKVKLVTKRFLGFEHKYATKIFKKNILKRINEFRKDEDGSMIFFFFFINYIPSAKR